MVEKFLISAALIHFSLLLLTYAKAVQQLLHRFYIF